MFNGARGVEKLAAVGETIRRDVQHAHDERALAKLERSRRKFQTESFSANHARSSLAQALGIGLERKSLGKDPAMIVSMKRCGCDLHACCRREAKSPADSHSSESESWRQENLVVAGARSCPVERGVYFEFRPKLPRGLILESGVP